MKTGRFRIRRAKTPTDIIKQTPDKQDVNIIKEIDIPAVLRSYQELYFLI
jgi:hypothetical protein